MGNKGNILVIDDEAGIREGCRRALQPSGFTIVSAVSAQDGLARIRGDVFDLVLLDAILPDGRGTELLAPILAKDPDIVCVIITGYATVQLAVEAIREGAYDFIPKPFTSDTLLMTVNRGLEKRRLSLNAKRHQSALEKLNRELEATNRNYMEMLSFVTHELKVPLASATMSLYSVKDKYLGELNSLQQRALGSVASSLEYFDEMIRNYLDLSRLEKGELRVSKASVKLTTEVIAPVLDTLSGALQERHMVVENHVPATVKIGADRNLLKIVYDNLVCNAIKYGREGGRIRLEAHQNEREIVLSVTNEGKGIPQDKMHLLFRKFGRLHGPEHAGKKGTGLGLYICREIVERHGGKIWAESKQGQWVRFAFTIPKLENTGTRRDTRLTLGQTGCPVSRPACSALGRSKRKGDER